jgi:hypothetical protein
MLNDLNSSVQVVVVGAYSTVSYVSRPPRFWPRLPPLLLWGQISFFLGFWVCPCAESIHLGVGFKDETSNILSPLYLALWNFSD